MTRILGIEGKAIAGADRKVIVASVLSIVGAILLVPLLGIERAVSSIRDVVDRKQVRIEEIASVIRAI